MMFSELYQYLLLHKEISVPGVGTFFSERTPARADFPNKQFLPPAYSFAMEQGGQLPGKNFFHWLAQVMRISEREAIFRFNDFAFDLKKQLMDGAEVNWAPVGVLSKGLSGEIRLDAAAPVSPGKPVPGEKVIRQKAEHMVRVGEDEKTAAEMTALLTKTDARRSYWWVFALVTGVLAAAFIGWHFSRNGAEPAAAANTAPIKPGTAGETYRILP